MMRFFLNRHNFIAFAILILGTCCAVNSSGNKTYAADDLDAVNQVIDNFQTAYSSKSLIDVKNLFHYQAIVGIQFEGDNSPDIMPLNEWIQSTREVFEERTWISDELTNRDINVYRGTMATVVCNYDYRDPSSRQMGMDIFTLMKVRGDWKIVSLIFSGEYVK